jgi:hypothetical protein
MHHACMHVYINNIYIRVIPIEKTSGIGQGHSDHAMIGIYFHYIINYFPGVIIRHS